MAIDGRVFLDTSILLAGLIEMGDASAAPRQILDAVARKGVERPMTAWHCCLEFYSVATRLPAGLRLEPEQACLLVTSEIMDLFRVCELPEAARVAFLAAAGAERVAGGRVYDAHIAEVARLAGARLVVTENRRHFVGLMRHGIRVLTAAEFADEHGS